MESRETAIPLKRNSKRSVERSSGTGTEVVKRFHSPGPIDRWRDRARARSEYAMLRELRERGLAVPHPIAVRKTERGWELATEWIEGTIQLSDVLSGRSPWPANAERLVRSLGELLARAHAIGLDHPDLHSGNVLVASDARVWLVDVHGARLASKPTPRIAVRDLIQLAADTRERLSATLRARALAAWRAALPEAFASALPPTRELGAIVEREARARRRATIERARRRWTRTSSSCRALSSARFTGFVSAQLGECDPLQLRARGDGVLLLDHARPRDLRAHWHAAARLLDHGVRAARPLAYSLAPTAWVALELPRGARTLSESLPASSSIARSLGELAGSFFDRGLAWPDDASLFVDEHHEVWLGSTRSLRQVSFDAPVRSMSLPRGSPVLRDEAQRAEFASAFVRAQRSGERTRARVTGELRAALGVSSNG